MEEIIKNNSKELSQYDSIIIFDLETSGLDFMADRIIEFGAVELQKNSDGKFEITATVNVIANPGFPIDPKITELTGITQEMIDAEGVSQEELHNVVKGVFSNKFNSLVMAYNIQFDITFANNLVNRHSKEKGKFVFDMLDVMALYKDTHDYPHRLTNAIETLGLSDKVVNSHRASDDAMATWEVFKKLFAMMKDSKYPSGFYINLVGYNQKYGLSGMKYNHVSYYGVGFNKNELAYKHKLKLIQGH